jgi:hypothetical protein
MNSAPPKLKIHRLSITTVYDFNPILFPRRSYPARNAPFGRRYGREKIMLVGASRLRNRVVSERPQG